MMMVVAAVVVLVLLVNHGLQLDVEMVELVLLSLDSHQQTTHN